MLLFAFSSRVHSAILINEFLANGVNDPDSEWIELFNDGNSEFRAINWKVSETSSSNFSFNASFAAKGFVILAGDAGAFRDAYPELIPQGIGAINITISNFNLGDASGEVILYDSSGATADSVRYSQQSGKKFENVSVGRYPDGSAVFANLSTLTPGARNDDKPPVMSRWINPPSNSSMLHPGDFIIVNITDDASLVKSATIKLGGKNHSMENIGDLWSFAVPPGLNRGEPYNLTAYFSDSYGKTGSDSLSNISIKKSNSPPSLASALLANSDFLGRTNGTLLAFFGYSDIDGDPMAAKEIVWHLNGSEARAYANLTSIPPEATSRHEEWAFSARAFDGLEWGEYARSNSIIVSNSRPVIRENIGLLEMNETREASLDIESADMDGDLLSYSVNDSRFSVGKNFIRWVSDSNQSGLYRLNFSASDSIDSDSIILSVNLKGIPSKEINFSLTGNHSSINTTINVSVFIDGEPARAGNLNGAYPVIFREGKISLIEFNYYFSPYNVLELDRITINASLYGFGAISIRGLHNRLNSTKTFFVGKRNLTAKSVCVKDEDIDYENISSGCDFENEHLISCGASAESDSSGYSCLDNGSIYIVYGLGHSAVKEQCRDSDGDGYGTGCALGDDCDDADALKTLSCPAPTPIQSVVTSSSDSGSGRSGSGGGGGVLCIPNWECSEWLECVDGNKNRICMDSNKCAFYSAKPAEAASCEKIPAANLESNPGGNATIKQPGGRNLRAIKPVNGDKSSRQLAKTSAPKSAGKSGLNAITGNAILSNPGSGYNIDSGFIIVISEIILIVGAYLLFSKSQ